MASVRDALSSVWDAVVRYVSPPAALEVSATAYGESWAGAEYDPEHAGSAIAAYPWARVGIEARATNLSQVPIRVYDAKTKEPVEDHWMLTLLRRPDPSMGGRRWRRQMVADYSYAGYMIGVITRVGGRPVRIRRRHPRGWSVVTDGKGDIIRWVDRSGSSYRPEDIFFVGDISWRDDPATSHLGESAIRPLDLGIRAATAAREQAGKAAKRGRLETLVSARSPLGEGGAQRVSDRIEDVRRNGTGTLVVGHHLEVSPLSLSPRDTEWAELDIRTRDETLAVMGVPPVRAQLPSANYGAAKQEMRQYWENLRALAELIDEELTELAGGNVIVAHSFESVEALQTSYTERLSRVKMWVELGATPYNAARNEGFVDPPLGPDTEPRTAQQTIPPNPATLTDTPQARTLRDEIAATLADAGRWMQDAHDLGMASEALTRHALADRLRGTPLAPLADEVADELADAVALAESVAGGRIRCDTLPAFGTEHAALLADALTE